MRGYWVIPAVHLYSWSAIANLALMKQKTALPAESTSSCCRKSFSNICIAFQVSDPCSSTLDCLDVTANLQVWQDVGKSWNWATWQHRGVLCSLCEWVQRGSSVSALLSPPVHTSGWQAVTLPKFCQEDKTAKLAFGKVCCDVLLWACKLRHVQAGSQKPYCASASFQAWISNERLELQKEVLPK